MGHFLRRWSHSIPFGVLVERRIKLYNIDLLQNFCLCAVLAQGLIICLTKLVTLKYTQYGGEGYLRGGDEGVACEGQLLLFD